MSPVSVSSALVGAVAVLGIVQLVLRWRAYRFVELRETLDSVEGVLQGERAFSSENAKKAERDLDVLVEELHAARVREAARSTLQAWKRAFASEPGPWMWVLGAPETQADRDRAARIALHEQNVTECLGASRDTRRAMNRIERWTYPPLR